MNLSVKLSILIATAFMHSSVIAQNEQALKQYFEGKMIVASIDLPASTQGINIFPEKNPQLDYGDYGNELKEFGAGVYSGESIIITKVVVKKNHIRFELGGGGYGGFWDESDYVSAPRVAKTAKEEELESSIKEETNETRKRELRKQLDYEKKKREEEQARINFEAEQAREIKRQRIAEKRAKSGSRIHLRFDRRIDSKDLDIDQILDQLSEFAVLENEIINPTLAVKQNQNEMHKGMSWNDANLLLGMPVQAATDNQCDLTIMTCQYEKGNEIIEAKFVEGVLVKYSITSK